MQSITSRSQLSTNHKLTITSRDQLSTNHKPSITSRDQLSTNHKLSIRSRDQLSTNHKLSFPQKQQQNYEVLLEIVDKVYSTMTEDTKLSTVYNKCLEFVKEKRPEWLNNFPKNIGFGKLLINSFLD